MSQNDQEGWDYEPSDKTKPTRKVRWRKMSLWVMLVSFCLLLLLGYNNHSKALQDPKFCSNCHEMQLNYTAWQSTAHSKVACLDCHKDVSIAGFLYKQMLGVNRVGETKVNVNDSACAKCHGNSRIITPPLDLQVPHSLHLQMGLACTQCHSTVTHGTAADSAPVKVGPNVQADNTFNPNRIAMSACMKCHNGTMATGACNACHADKTPPGTHKAADFKVNHGITAVQNVAACNNCHQYDVALQLQNAPKGNGWSETQSLARKTGFCIDCHSTRPQTHQSLYTVSHGAAAKQDSNRCLTCHNQDEKGKVVEKPAATVTCVQCHYSQHPADFLTVHPKQVDKNNQSKCFSCHDAGSCNDCHNRTFRAGRKL